MVISLSHQQLDFFAGSGLLLDIICINVVDCELDVSEGTWG